MFAHDRDLLRFEPALFRDLAWNSQRLSRGQGTVSGTTLTISTPEVAFDAAGITAGHVATINGISYEVLGRLFPTQLHISRLRADANGPAIPPSPVTNVECGIYTFAPQIGVVHRQVLRMLGIDPFAAPVPGRPSETAITNADALVRLECVGALHLIYAAAGAASDETSPANQRAAMYKDLFAQERTRAHAELDLDGDGVPEVTRRCAIIQLVR